MVDEEPVTDEEEMIDGGEIPCCSCGKKHVMLYHRWNDAEGDLWVCEDCK